VPLVFQYGSNTDADRLNSPQRLHGDARNPRPAQTVGRFEVGFDKWSETNGCAAADLFRPETGGQRVWGVVYTVSEEGLGRLEDVEGSSYRAIDIDVEYASGGIDTVNTFVVNGGRRRTGLWTSAEYVGHIVRGLRARAIPEDYIQHLIDVAIRTNERAADQEAGRMQNALIGTL